MERQERYDEKLVQILRSACGIFAERGFHNTSVRDVAAATGVSPAGLYYYFKSKEELLFLVLEDSLQSLLERIRQETNGTKDPVRLLRIIVRTHLTHFDLHRQEMRVLANEWETLSGPFDKEIRRLMREYAGLVTRTFRRLSPERSSQELRAAAFGLFGMLTWVDQWHRPGRDLSVELLADEFSDIFLKGFLNADASSQAVMTNGKESATGEEDRSSSPFAILSGPGF